MKEDFVTYEIAVKLKEKRYNCELPYAMYNEIGQFCLLTTSAPYHVCESGYKYREYYDYNDFDKNDFIAPTISQVLKWLIEEKNLHIEIVSTAYGYIYIVSDTPNKGGTDRVNSRYRGRNDGGAWDDYNECVLDAIEYVIENLI